ncbi:MAG: pectate lyase [Chthoniobacteraceae bacterium]
MKRRKICGISLGLVLTGSLLESSGAPLAQERVDALPSAQHAAWQHYLDVSNAAWRKDHETLYTEMIVEGLAQPLPAPAGGDFKLPSHPQPEWFAAAETRQLATVVISYQTPSGGWSKKLRFTGAPRKRGTLWSSQSAGSDPWHYVGTFDNRATTEELRLLAGVWLATQRQDCAGAFLRGLDYIFAAQYPNGGWPQVWPVEGKYHDDVTFNDDAMIHVLELLRDLGDGAPEFAFVDEARRTRARQALAAGIECILQAQVRQQGSLTAWCAQHDPLTLAPSPARLKEPTSISGGESVGITRFLMQLPQQTPPIIAAIEGSLVWFERVKITTIEKTSKNGKSTYVPVAQSSRPLWARFYDVATNKPLFSGAQDGVIYNTFAEMQAHNHIGYDYYTAQPEALITKDQARWRKVLLRKSSGSQR